MPAHLSTSTSHSVKTLLKAMLPSPNSIYDPNKMEHLSRLTVSTMSARGRGSPPTRQSSSGYTWALSHCRRTIGRLDLATDLRLPSVQNMLTVDRRGICAGGHSTVVYEYTSRTTASGTKRAISDQNIP